MEREVVNNIKQEYVSQQEAFVDFNYGTGQFKPRVDYSVSEQACMRTFVDQQKELKKLQQDVSAKAMNTVLSNNLGRGDDEGLRLSLIIGKLNTKQRFAFDIVRHHVLLDNTADRKQL